MSGVVVVVFPFSNDVPPVPQRNVSIAAERGAVRPSIVSGVVMNYSYIYAVSAIGIDVVSGHMKYCIIAYGIT